MTLALALLTAAVWAVLLVARDGFWRAREREDDWTLAPPAAWPAVTAVVPARDEAAVVGTTLAALFAQDYPGRFNVILVDDESGDGTGDIAQRLAEASGCQDRLTVLRTDGPPPGWTGKLNAMARGFAEAGAAAEPPRLVLFCDADIALAPDTLRRLICRALGGRRVMVSLMALLSVRSLPERLIVPAFIYFFMMLYPFAAVADPRRRVAAAAGGCMLVEREALVRAGGLAAIRAEIIDDCALGRLMKGQGPIDLALTKRAVSLRSHASLHPLRRMITRSAYAELRYSPLRLALALCGLALTFLAAPLLAVFGEGAARWIASGVTLAMLLSFLPILRFYGLSRAWALALPGIAALYGLFTLESALLSARGRGGEWKGRYQTRAARGGRA